MSNVVEIALFRTRINVRVEKSNELRAHGSVGNT
jgi:hypothetical protein